MKPGKTLPLLWVLALFGSLAVPMHGEESAIVTAELEKHFVLAVGETGRVESEGLEVTLRSASDDSGCFAPDDCSLALFKGTIAMRRGEEKEMVTVFSVMRGGKSASLDFAGYVIRFDTVRRLGKDNIQATFIVEESPERKADKR